MKHFGFRTFLFVGCVVALLLMLQFLPSLSVDGNQLREVSLLSDVLDEEPDSLKKDSAVSALMPDTAFVDTCRTGMTCIEDYSGPDQRGMQRFYEKLSQIANLDRPVRIAYFGDSFIEADILTSDLRAMLQQKFGGSGVGYLHIVGLGRGYRPTVEESSKGWESHTVTDKRGFDKQRQGMANRYYLPTKGAFTQANGVTRYAANLDKWERSFIYLHAGSAFDMTSIRNKKDTVSYHVQPDNGVQRLEADGPTTDIKWVVDSPVDPATAFFGVALESRRGVCVDNFSLRSASGTTLQTIPAATLHAFNEVRPYDLIILQYGLNVAGPQSTKFENYEKSMIAVIDTMKVAFPEAGILLVGVSDRAYKAQSGTLQTMPGILNLIPCQQGIAAKTGIAYWNLFEAMGGEGSIQRMVKANPSEANRDYTHINFKGGKHLATLFYETLVYGKEQYDKRKGNVHK